MVQSQMTSDPLECGPAPGFFPLSPPAALEGLWLCKAALRHLLVISRCTHYKLIDWTIDVLTWIPHCRCCTAGWGHGPPQRSGSAETWRPAVEPRLLLSPEPVEPRASTHAARSSSGTTSNIYSWLDARVDMGNGSTWSRDPKCLLMQRFWSFPQEYSLTDLKSKCLAA